MLGITYFSPDFSDLTDTIDNKLQDDFSYKLLPLTEEEVRFFKERGFEVFHHALPKSHIKSYAEKLYPFLRLTSYKDFSDNPLPPQPSAEYMIVPHNSVEARFKTPLDIDCAILVIERLILGQQRFLSGLGANLQGAPIRVYVEDTTTWRDVSRALKKRYK